MKLYLQDQTRKFEHHLELLKSTPVMAYKKTDLIRKVSTILLNSYKDLNPEILFHYKIFPGKIMSFLTQWDLEKREMRKGDTIVQQAFLPPIKTLSTKIIVGVRISDIIKDPTRIGFSYETLGGHVEKGISTFTFEKIDRQQSIFKIETFSRPGNFLSKLAGPVFSVPYQAYCTRQALLNVKRQVEMV